MLKRGIILLATKWPYYGRMCYNLAMTIKAVDADVHITLLHNGNGISHLPKHSLWVFDNIVELQTGAYNEYSNKLMLPLHTPYEETIFIDADCIWVNKNSPEMLFDALEAVEYTGITEGYHNYDNEVDFDINNRYYFWADLQDIKKIYNLTGKIYQWRSEFFYFKNTDKVRTMFNCALQVQQDCKLISVKKFAHSIPDELGINIAACEAKINPHVYKWQPSYWPRLYNENIPQIEVLQNNYYTLSCGSNASTGALKRVYDRIVKASAYRLKLQHTFPLVSKKEMLPTRQQM